MGEAKRKKEAVLKGPCPCGSGRLAFLCCYTGKGWQWHKPAMPLGLSALPQTGRVEKCYMKGLGSCVPPISGEHIISESVCGVLMGHGDFSISGVPWLDDGETKTMAPPKANCLCTKHNSSLSPLDSAAYYFFASLRSFLETDGRMRHAIISGHDIERWLLKTTKAAAISGYLGRAKAPLPGVFVRDEAILGMLDNPALWPEGAGLYCTMKQGDLTENTARFQVQPLMDCDDNIEALAFNILGFRFVLLLSAPNFSTFPFLIGAKYRPGRIQIRWPTSVSWITLSWDDNNTHDVLTVSNDS